MYDDGKSRQSALKSATGSNTRLASIPDKKLEEATQIYVDQTRSKRTTESRDFKEEQVIKPPSDKPHGSTFDGRVLPANLIDFAAVSHAPNIHGERSEMRGSVKLEHLNTQENEVPPPVSASRADAKRATNGRD